MVTEYGEPVEFFLEPGAFSDTSSRTIYNLYTGTIFQGSQWRPRQVVLLMRGICKGETTKELSAESELNYKTVLTMCHRMQANAKLEQPTTALHNTHSETDEMFQNSGEKRQTAP